MPTLQSADQSRKEKDVSVLLLLTTILLGVFLFYKHKD